MDMDIYNFGDIDGLEVTDQDMNNFAKYRDQSNKKLIRCFKKEKMTRYYIVNISYLFSTYHIFVIRFREVDV